MEKDPKLGAPKISVLCPVFRGAATLRRAVDSIRQQGEQDWELILLDDGSDDDSYLLCQELAAEEDRIRVERHGKNKGLGAAMESLVGLARGRYLAIQEQDDISFPGRLEIEAELLDARPEVGLVSGIAEWVDFAGQRLRLFPHRLVAGEPYPQDQAAMVRFLMVDQCKIVNAGCMFRREVLDHPSIFFDAEARMSVDWQFFLRVAHHHRIWGLDCPVVKVERDAGRASLTAQKELQFREARRCLDRIFREYRKDPSSPVDRRLFRRAMATQLLLEGRHWGGFVGLFRHLGALARDPGRPEIWRSFAELMGRCAKKVLAKRRKRGAEP